MDHQILLELYNRYHRELYLYLYSLCQSHPLAEDLLQETFLKAILSLGDHHPNMRAWLYLVARNLCLNSLKKAGRAVSMEQAEPPPDFSSQDDPLNRFIQDERKKALFEAMKHLEPRKREILIMQYWSQMTQKEIAAVLQITPENVRVLAFRAKKELKHSMEVNGYDLS
ncbi:MAG: RNA polymerase sigma factor [Eubacteriales bacterium]|nr:RNA polymerase sigma factor [Eubacteriales bacterium]